MEFKQNLSTVCSIYIKSINYSYDRETFGFHRNCFGEIDCWNISSELIWLHLLECVKTSELLHVVLFLFNLKIYI